MLFWTCGSNTAKNRGGWSAESEKISRNFNWLNWLNILSEFWRFSADFSADFRTVGTGLKTHRHNLRDRLAGGGQTVFFLRIYRRGAHLHWVKRYFRLPNVYSIPFKLNTYMYLTMRHFCAALLKRNDESNDSNILFYSYMYVEDKHNIVTPQWWRLWAPSSTSRTWGHLARPMGSAFSYIFTVVLYW
jgi:hypothetical protein